MITPTSRNIALDALKLALSFMVVGLHTGFLSDFNETAKYLTVNGIFRIAVPIFFIINGFYFYQTLAAGNERRWLKRAGTLYALWMLFYSYFCLKYIKLSHEHMAMVIFYILFGYWHLWYLVGTLGAALILIAAEKFHVRTVYRVSFSAVMFAVGVALQYNLPQHFTDNPTLAAVLSRDEAHRNFLFMALPFFHIGFLIRKHALHRSLNLWLVSATCVLGMVLLLAEANLSLASGGGNKDNYLSLLVACPSIALLFMRMNMQGTSKNLSNYANGIFFLHPACLMVFAKYFHEKTTLLTFFIIIISSIGTWLILKARPLSRHML